ncbi:hypothetical protein [Butyrivibrio sp. AE3004]|uniref:hypothetical protein n=1 Tax=Butyrivibrio sp. AE3004 TaxID=1506994 RepID=UPI000493DC1D|nr:hypothetical protein [Butyrivibrio sp. AE3004]
MEKYIVPRRICDKSIDVLRLEPEIANWLKEHKMETIRDFIQNQESIPPKYCDEIKVKIKYLVLALAKRGYK